MRTWVKVCGVSTPEGVEAAVEAGADALGFVFALSPRRVSPAAASRLCARLPQGVATVAVFRYPSQEEVAEVLEGFEPDFIQSEPGRSVLGRFPARALLPVFHDSENVSLRVARYRDAYPGSGQVLLEGPGRGGRGVRPDWERAAELANAGSIVLAGGLYPENVAEALTWVRPFGVDVSSGVESELGHKDPDLIFRFVQSVRAAETRLSASEPPAPAE